MPENMRPQDWDTLVWSLKRQHCILLLGPDTPAADDGVSPARLRQQLARALTADLGDGRPQDDALFAAAHRYRSKVSTMDLQQQVEAFYEQHQDDRCQVLQDLASLPFYFVISSCHDNLLRTAFEAHGKQAQVEHYNFRGPKPMNVDIGTIDRPLVYHLQGIPSVPESLVLDDDDLLDSLVAIVKKDPELPRAIGAELGKSGKSLLFLGFGIRQWHLRVLLHELRASQADSRSFALEAFDGAVTPDLGATVVFYHRYKIEIFSSDIPLFVTQLKDRYDKSGKTVLPALTSPASIGIRPPRVFICHASEDKQLAQLVADKLRRAGCDPWLDKDKDADQSGLRGGDHWDRRIRDELAASDYMLVVVSQALNRKQVGYVNREISLALERQKDFRYPNRFIFPVQFEDCEIPADFSDLQVERFDPNDLDPLAKLILRDYQRRVARQ